MRANWVEVFAGGAVLLVAVVFGIYAFGFSSNSNSDARYRLWAQFPSAEGISTGGPVRLAGVQIGHVGKLTLDRDNYLANVEIFVDETIDIPADSEVKVATDGLLGGAYVEIVPGGDIVMLERDEQFHYATGSISFIGLLSSFVTSGGSEEE